MANTTRTQIAVEVDAVYQRTLLLRVIANFPFVKFAQIRDIQRNGGTNTTEIQGDQAADTFDQLTRDVLVAGTSVFYANGVGGRSSVAANAAVADYRKIARALRKNKARKLTKITTGTD